MSEPFKLLHRLALSSLLALPLLSAAQQTVRIVVPFAAGSSTDQLARQLAETLREINGNNYLVDNKPGASAVIGTAEVAKAKPDGNTLLMTTGGHATNAVLYEKLPFDPMRDFTPISQLTQSAGFLLMVPPNSPYKTLDQLLSAARANPGKLTYGSAGIGNTTHLAGALFERAAGIKLVHVPYKGTPMNDLMAGHIDMLFWGVGFAVPIVKGGKAGAVALAGDKRTLDLPDVPTLAEKGISGVEVPAWSALFAPAGLSPELARKIHADVYAAMNKPSFIAAYHSPGTTRLASTPAQFDDALKKDVARLRKDIAPLGIRMD